MCITMGWSSCITKHDYTYNMLTLSHNQTWLHMTMCFFIYCYCFFPYSKLHTRTRCSLDYMKRLNIFFKDRVFGHRVTFIQVLARKDCDHSPALVCTRGVMFGGGHVYPTLQNFWQVLTTAKWICSWKQLIKYN
jgi:hypothetical protein